MCLSQPRGDGRSDAAQRWDNRHWDVVILKRYTQGVGVGESHSAGAGGGGFSDVERGETPHNASSTLGIEGSQPLCT